MDQQDTDFVEFAKNLVIICVDDEPIVLESLIEQLKRSLVVFEIEAAESAEEAIELLQRLKEENIEVALIISDHIMPQMRGDEFLINVHHQYPSILKIMMTGQADVQAIGKVVNKANLYRYIAKPWDETDLILTVKEAIRSYAKDKQLALQNQQLRSLNTSLEQKVKERTAELQKQVDALELAQREILNLNQKLEQLSYRDGLTGIANRRFFDLTLASEWEKACNQGYALCLMLIDVDYFKKYNDYYGHPQGDECLKQVALSIQSMTRPNKDLTARYGGEEFVVLLVDIDASDAYPVAESIAQAIYNLEIPHALSDVRPWVTVSVGLYVQKPSVNTAIEEFIDRADQFLYKAKKQGRACVVGNSA